MSDDGPIHAKRGRELIVRGGVGVCLVGPPAESEWVERIVRLSGGVARVHVTDLAALLEAGRWCGQLRQRGDAPDLGMTWRGGRRAVRTRSCAAEAAPQRRQRHPSPSGAFSLRALSPAAMRAPGRSVHVGDYGRRRRGWLCGFLRNGYTTL